MASFSQSSDASSQPSSIPIQTIEQSTPCLRSNGRRWWTLPGITVLFLALTTGCAFSDLLQPATPTPVPTRVLAPTFTPTPEALQPLVVVTPPSDGSPGVIIIQPTIDADRVVIAIPPTDTPIPVATATQPPTTATLFVTPGPGETIVAGQTPLAAPTPEPLIPTATPIPTETPTPEPTPTPFIIVETGFAALRTGPGVEYPLVAQLGPNIPVAIIGRNTEGTWYEICCVNGFSVWVPTTHVRMVNDASQAALVVAQPPPTSTPTFTPTWTPTITPTPTSTPYPFERAIGPQFFPTGNEFLTIWAKLFVGTLPTEEAAPGYCVDVKFEGFDRPSTNDRRPSFDHFEFSASPGAGNRVDYNFKYEYKPPDPKTIDPNTTDTRLTLLGTGTWIMYVSDCAGHQLSDTITFTTNPSNPNREIYVGWVRVR